jgi:Asp-tRNA(Asn)/Glu-tRNA(Gln) amidotransferase A subunit family amidase
MKTRREFLATAGLGLLGASITTEELADAKKKELASRSADSLGEQTPSQEPAGMPPAFGTAVPVGPEVSATTLAEAQKLVQVEMVPKDLEQASKTWRVNMAPLYERRVGPKKIALENDLAPWSRWNPVLPGTNPGPEHNRFIRSKIDAGPLPENDADIAFASVAQLSRWIEGRKLTSERLTNIYLSRLEQFNPTLRCVITLMREHALVLAKRADAEIAAGKYRGPLHGIPWGGKDLLDTAGIATTYGAEPFRNRVPKDDAAVVRKLNEAGAVLVAKLSLGALALNDIWFGGQTMNPWLLEEGASGSSAGPGAATAAGLVGFSIGSETGGSIVSPSMRCGVTGLRPTYGRVPRTAAFEELTLQHGVDQLKMQTFDSWPNLFRQGRFLSAVDFVQADRMRRKVALEMARIFSDVDLLLVPSLRDEMLTITNFTGQPSLILRAGFVAVTQARSDWAPDPEHPLPKFSPARRVPHGVTLIGKLFQEGTLAQAGLALEKHFGVVQERPKGF